MALQTFVGSFTVPAATGNKVVTGVGFQPKVVLFFGCRRSADGSTGSASALPEMATILLGVGISSSSRACMYTSDDFSGGSPTLDNTRCIWNNDSNTGSSGDFAADFVSQDSDGFTVNFTIANATAYVVNYTAIGGSDLTGVKLQQFSSLATTGNQGITGVGFQPDALIVFGTTFQSTAGSAGTTASSSLGFGTSGAQGFTAGGYVAAAGITSVSYQRSDRIYASVRGGGAATTLEYQASLVSLDSDGFTLNWDIAQGTTQPVYALCLKGGSYKTGVFNTRTATGAQSVTGVGAAPVGMLCSSQWKVSSASNRDVLGFVGNLGAVSDTTHRASSGYQDNGWGSAYLDRANVVKVISDSATPTVLDAADLTSFDADGFTLNYATVDATAREFIFLTMASPVAAPLTNYPGNVDRNHFKVGTGMSRSESIS